MRTCRGRHRAIRGTASFETRRLWGQHSLARYHGRPALDAAWIAVATRPRKRLSKAPAAAARAVSASEGWLTLTSMGASGSTVRASNDYPCTSNPVAVRTWIEVGEAAVERRSLHRRRRHPNGRRTTLCTAYAGCPSAANHERRWPEISCPELRDVPVSWSPSRLPVRRSAGAQARTVWPVPRTARACGW